MDRGTYSLSVEGHETTVRVVPSSGQMVLDQVCFTAVLLYVAGFFLVAYIGQLATVDVWYGQFVFDAPNGQFVQVHSKDGDGYHEGALVVKSIEETHDGDVVTCTDGFSEHTWLHVFLTHFVPEYNVFDRLNK